MIVEMGCLILGVPVGFLLRRKPLVIKITDQVLTWSVRILLLLLGLALGADDRLMSQMDTIGARGIFISLRGGEPHRRAPPRADHEPPCGALRRFPYRQGRRSGTVKESIIVLFFFSVGVLGGRLDLLPADWLGLVHEASNLAVYAMLAAVGMSLGFDSRAWRILRDLKGWVVLVPLMIIVGTFLGGVAAWTMLDMSFRDVMAVAAGFGYYSLSSMLINQLANVSLGSMALISNMVRELVTLLFAPLFARVFGGLGPLSAAGAASDTCLPAIIRTSGERNTILGIFSGMVLTIAVPIFVTSIFAWL